MIEEIKVYTKNRCPKCDATKSFFESHGISFVTVNVEENEEALEYVKYDLGVTSLPVVTQGDVVVVGFEPEKLAKMAKLD